VAGVVAELTRFVRAGNLITAEVTLRNTGSLPAKFSCDGWQLIDEQTGGKSSADLAGGVVSIWSPPETLAGGGNARDVGEVQGRGGRLVGQQVLRKHRIDPQSSVRRARA
jgi:hypothetical protein